MPSLGNAQAGWSSPLNLDKFTSFFNVSLRTHVTMQHQRTLAGLVLSWLPCSLALNPYLFDPDNNLRPDNATNLDYTRYDKIGS